MITLRKELKRKTGGLRRRKVAKASLALYSVNTASGSSPYFLVPRLNNRLNGIAILQSNQSQTGCVRLEFLDASRTFDH
jgi:hypothetical protein